MKMRQRNQPSSNFFYEFGLFWVYFPFSHWKGHFHHAAEKKKKRSWAFTVHAMAAVCATKPTQYIDSNVNSKVLVSVCQGHQPNIEKSREINCFKNLIKMQDHMLKNSRCNYAKFIRIWEENHVFLGTIHWMLISAFL